MEARKTGWKPKLLMLVVSSFFIIAILGVAELYCRSLFLYGDPMHLSADGTKLVADVVCANTDACG